MYPDEAKIQPDLTACDLQQSLRIIYASEINLPLGFAIARKYFCGFCSSHASGAQAKLIFVRRFC